MSIYEQIRHIAKENMEGINARILRGRISSINPFLVLVEQKLELPKEALIFPQHLQEVKLITKDWKTEPCDGGDIASGGTKEEIERYYVLKPKLEINDQLILINLGQKYLIFDKVGDVNATTIITQQ